MSHEGKVLIGNRRKKYESGGGHAEPLPGLAPPAERWLWNLSTEELLFSSALWWHGPIPNTKLGTRWDPESHLIHDLAALQESKSLLRNFVECLLLTLNPGIFERKQSRQQALLRRLTWKKSQRVSCSAFTYGLHVWSPPEGPVQQRVVCLAFISTWWWDPEPLLTLICWLDHWIPAAKAQEQTTDTDLTLPWSLDIMGLKNGKILQTPVTSPWMWLDFTGLWKVYSL